MFSTLPLPGEIRAFPDCVAPTRSSLDKKFALLAPVLRVYSMSL